MRTSKKSLSALLAIIMTISLLFGGFSAYAADKTVNDQAELVAALTDITVGTITLGANIDVSSAVSVDREVIIEGNNKTLSLNNIETIGGSTGSLGLGISGNATVKNLTVTTTNLADNLVEVAGSGVTATLENITVQGSQQAGLTILDGATVDLIGDIVFTGNTWGGIEVENVSETHLTFADGANLTYSGSNTPVVWVDANVTTPDDFVTDTANALGAPIYVDASGNAVAADNINATQVWWNVIPTTPTPVTATMTMTSQTGVHDNKVRQEFQLKDTNGVVISLATTNVSSITVLKPNEPTATPLQADTDSTLWFNVQNPAGDYKYTVTTISGIVYEATLNWAGTQTATATRVEEPSVVNTGDGIEYQKYLLIDSTNNQVNLATYDAMYQIKAPTVGDVSVGGPYTAAGDTANILYVPVNKADGTFTYLVKNDAVWSEAVITLKSMEVTSTTPVFTVGVPETFTVGTIANSDADVKVKAYFTLPNDTTIQYQEGGVGEWLLLAGEFGPAEGFPLGDITTTFRGTFTSTGTKTVVVKFKSVLTNTLLGSKEIAATVNEAPDTIKPAAPTGLAANVDGTQANLTWNVNTETDVVGYNLYQNDTKVNDAAITATSYMVTGLTYGTSYSFTLTAVDSAGNESEKSSPITVTPEAPVLPNQAPTVISGKETQMGNATPASADSSILAVKYTADVSQWFHDADDATLTYTIVSATDANGDVSGVTLDAHTGALIYTPNTDQASSAVTIVVKANDGTLDSIGNVTITIAVGAVPDNAPGEQVDLIPPATPTMASTGARDGQVELTWDANSETDLAGYNVYQDGVKVHTALRTETTYTVTGLTNGTAYVFEISAFDNAGNESVKSWPKTVTPIANVPTDPTTKNVGEIPGNNILLVGDYAFDLNVDAATSGYNLNNFLIAAQTAHSEDATHYHVYAKIGVQWFDIVTDPNLATPISDSDLSTINGDGHYRFMNMN